MRKVIFGSGNLIDFGKPAKHSTEAPAMIVILRTKLFQTFIEV